MHDTRDRRLRQAPTTLSRRLLDGVLLLPSGTDEPLHLTSPGDDMWAILKEPRTLVELAEELSSMFDVGLEVVLLDIEPLIVELLEAGAIDALSPPAGQSGHASSTSGRSE